MIAALLVTGTGATAQTAAVEDVLGEAVRASMLDIARDAEGNLYGSGWDRLMTDAAEAQFFLIGEQHATADIAEISAAIHRGLAQRDYEYMAVEIGPWSTRYAEQLIRENNDAVAAIGDAPGGGFALPFLFFAEDAELTAQAVRLSSASSHALFGLDQEFIAAGPVLALRLEELVRTDEQRSVVAAFAEATAANVMYLGTAEPEQFAPLRTAFDAGEDAEALALVDAMLLSNEIYGPFVRQTGPIYPANLARENYMKRNFLDQFARIEERDGHPPRIFFKFGASHMMRGHSTTNVPALGDFLVEWGRTREFGLVNVMIDCRDGSVVDVRSGAISPCQSYMLEEGSLLGEAADGRALTLIDLRPLRSLIRSSTEIDDASRDMIFAFDYYLAVADVRPATVIPAPIVPAE
ncbi:hypothetical protein HFP57_04050 [Parasphingopyxis algicola]|uniref:hypothetical protein n=1 Tax=Parasphingopyxis algicola TaxID=2026624 RepID=UPI0015A2C75B|nr:hypothetical protein [Parasphingopyxis algicola]QLC24282.1 hypothetical protein HFP57_04050 [Parasphingopyxis algicola]